jgi:ketosteroid isomerase-like protein
MDAQATMRLMFDTMDAYDRADFDRLAEIYAEDAQWRNADPNGPHCRNRDDIFCHVPPPHGRRNPGGVR